MFKIILKLRIYILVQAIIFNCYAAEQRVNTDLKATLKGIENFQKLDSQNCEVCSEDLDTTLLMQQCAVDLCGPAQEHESGFLSESNLAKYIKPDE